MDATSLSTGTVIDRYTVDAPIGEGGMAMVFRVRHNQLGTLHALKVLTLGGRQIADRLRQEGRVQATLQHPNVVTVTDMIDLHGSPGLIMQYIEGPSLDEYLRATRLTVEQADELARGILGGVAAAHRQGLIHRDLKPANIMLHITPRGLVPKITDFGLAKVLGTGGGGFSKTRTGSTMGTPHYMSPEQVRDSKNVGPATDIFALGAILYELVCARRAFDGDDLLQIFNAVAQGRYTSPRELVPELPERMETAIRAALQVEPTDRPDSCDALLDLWLGDGASGHVASPRSSAFDPDSLERARSFGSSSPPAPSKPSQETWAGGALASSLDEAVPVPPSEELERSLDRPRATSSDSLGPSRSLVVGLGSVGLLGAVLLGGAVLIGGAGIGAAWWLSGDTPTTGVAPTIEETTTSPLGVQESSGPVAAAPRPAPSLEPRAVAGAKAEADAGTAIPDATTSRGAAAEPPPPPIAVAAPEPPVAEPPPEPVLEAEPEPELAAGPDPIALAEPVRASVPEPEPEVAPAPEPSRPELTPMLANDDPAERRKGLDNLMQRNTDDAVRLHVWMVKEEPDSTVRQHALDTLVERMDDKNGDYWIMLEGVRFALKNGGERDASVAAAALGRNSADPNDLRAGLAHWSPKVRRASIDAVAGMKNKAPLGFDFVPLLEPLVQDSDRSVSKRASSALSDLR
jgi:serine/threonine-protein kinase